MVAKRRNSFGLVGFALLLTGGYAAKVIADELLRLGDSQREDREHLVAACAVLATTLAIMGVRAVRGWGRSDFPAEDWSPPKAALHRAGRYHRGEDLELVSGARLSMGTIIPGSLLLIGLLFFLAEPPPPLPWMLVAVAVIGALTARIWRMRIRCADQTVTVHGPLLNRRISVDAVVAVTYGDSHAYPAIWWRGPTGVLRCTRLHGFWVGGGGEDSDSYNAVQLARLMGWIGANHERDRAGLAQGAG
jgi:hypothetical protein